MCQVHGFWVLPSGLLQAICGWFSLKVFGGDLQVSILNLYFQIQICAMASVIFPEKDFSRIFSDVHRYNTVFLDRIRERQWYRLVYDNTDLDACYRSDLVK